jgi:hypothetical protein
MIRIQKRATVLAVTAVVAVGASAVAAGMMSAHAATSGCQVTYAVASQWQGGFSANVSVTNLGDPVTSWALKWSYTAGQTVTQAWNATVTQSGSQVTATNVSYNGAIATGGSASFGFNGSWTSSNPEPASFTLNGTTCTGTVATGTPTANPTTASPTPSRTASSPTPTASPTPSPMTGALYVAPNGSASAAGTQAAPTTLPTALSRIGAGGTIYLRGGTYNYPSTITIAVGNDGTSSARKTLSAYPGETPVLDFSAQSESSANRGVQLMANYWHVFGIQVQHAGDNGVYVGGSNNIIERVVTAYNRDTGLQLGRISSSTPTSQWPANNLVISSESHDNMDSAGENADGFAAKLTTGTGNVFRYDVSHNNIDDGWDLYTKTDTGAIGPVTIEYSLSYGNGTLTNGTVNVNGDRNGFKLGGDSIAVNHTVQHDIAYHNGHDGFTYNSNPGNMTVSNNVSVDNAERNFHWEAGNSVFRNNTSCRFNVSGTNDKLSGSVDSSNQFWTGTNGSRCSTYRGALGWSFASDGHLAVTFNGAAVNP